MASKPGCIFCAIVSGQTTAHKVYEDDLTMVFMDIFPVVEGHTLIVTKGHGDNIYEVDSDSLAAVGRTSQKIANAIRRVFQPDGLGVFQLNGAAAGQTVFHYHTHLIPRGEGEQLSIHAREQASDEVLAATAAKLRAAVEAQS